MFFIARPKLLLTLGIAIIAGLIAIPPQTLQSQTANPVRLLPVPPQNLAGQTQNPRGAVSQASTAAVYQLFLPMIGCSPAPVLPPSKKGIGLTYDQCNDPSTVGARWHYDWSTNPANCTGVENVPMIWGSGSIATTVSGNSTWIMGFNEPDDAAQSNLSPDQAATAWRQIEQKYPGRKLLAPVPSSNNPQWLVNFRNAYIAQYGTPPQLNGLASHCYAYYAQDCINLTQWYITQAQQWQVPEVWVTEFAFWPCYGRTANDTNSQMGTFVQWLNSQSIVTRYAWFAARIQGSEAWAFKPSDCNSPLVDYSSGSLTVIGQGYASVR